MSERPRLVEPSASPRRPANVMILFGFPWHTSEAAVRDYLTQLHPTAPTTTRLYTNPTNGSSRGICFVEYGTSTARQGRAQTSGTLRQVKSEPNPVEDETIAVVAKKVEETPFERRGLTLTLYHLTNSSWDRGGRLPDLPSDPPPIRGGAVEGYGSEGFTVRCGPSLGLANTVTPTGMAHMQALRKRLREEEAAMEDLGEAEVA